MGKNELTGKGVSGRGWVGEQRQGWRGRRNEAWKSEKLALGCCFLSHDCGPLA